MVCFGYEAKGDGTPDICYYSVGRDEKFKETVWFTCPVVAILPSFQLLKPGFWVKESGRTVSCVNHHNTETAVIDV